ncbi:MAG: MBL fold metallo-hydrolase, partial [Chloroflexi bacterium]|nr:MBL fold metallo-hydrolase [Chloroflexota bacterium]
WFAISDMLSSLPFSSISFGGFSSPWAFTTYVAITLVSFAALKRFGRPPPRPSSAGLEWRRFAPIAAVSLPIAALVGSAGILMRPSDTARLEVTIIDVGQGDAILIEAPDGQDILVDGGPGGEVLRGLGSELNWRDRSIELLVLTHPQADHLVGLLDVLDRYDVQQVIAGPGRSESIGYGAWLDALRAEGLDAASPLQGASFDLGRGAHMDVLGPGEDTSTSQLNNTSLVLRLVWGDVSFLLTGDIESDAELALVASGAQLQSTVLKVPHHGSRTSSSEAFLAAVQPSISVVSAGEGNPFGHPHEDVARRLARWSRVLATAESGSVHFETDGTRLWVVTTLGQ